MALKEFNLDIINAKETVTHRNLRAKLRLPNTWRISHVTTDSDEPLYSDLYPDIREAAHVNDLKEANLGEVRYFISQQTVKGTYRCPCCHKDAKVKEYRTREYKHLTDAGHKCFLMVNQPKLNCENCGRKILVRFPAALPGKSYTRGLAKGVMASLRTRTRSGTADLYNIHMDTVDAILNDCIHDALLNQDLSYVTGVYMDETQFGHGQDYITVFVDQNHKVIYMCRGHGKDTLDRFRDHLIIQGGDPENIRFFSADMSVAYESGITALFRNAELIWDRFHLAKAVNDVVNDIRKELIKRKKGESLNSVKYVLLRHEGNLNDEQIARLKEIRLNNPEMALAYDMKESFLDIIKIPDPRAMRRTLLSWIEWVEFCGHDALKKKAAKFKEKLDRILNWTRYPISNSVCEGINKNIQDARRQAYGYRDAKMFYNLIFLRQGDLTFRF